jgi:hypothetical protein
MEQNIIGDLASIQLTLVGISFSIFTILYSLVIGKLDLLQSISKQIKEGNRSPEIMQLEIFCLKSLKRLRRMNFWTIIICITSILLFIILWQAKSVSLSNTSKNVLFIVNYIDFLGILILIGVVFRSYFSSTKYD